MMAERFDVLVVGGGPAGYGCALRCAKHGLTVAVVERAHVGGTCLNVGCIPSKALIHAASTFHQLAHPAHLAEMGIAAPTPLLDLAALMRWKDGIVQRLRTGLAGSLQRATVHVVNGDAEIIDPHTVRVHQPGGSLMLTTSSLVVATGSQPLELPNLPFGGPVVSSSGLVALDTVPERLAVVGGGYIGIELGTAFAKLGAAVTIVEQALSVLSAFDTALTRPVVRRLAALGVQVQTNTTVVGYADGRLATRTTHDEPGQLKADAVLVAAGRRPVTEGFGLERLGLRMHERAIAVDAGCRTSARHVYAIGDVTGEPMLAHRGIAQGELVADTLAGHPRTWDHRAVPFVCFTDPEICSVGTDPAQAAGEFGTDVVVGQAPFAANGRAAALVASESTFVRIVAQASSGTVLGIQAVGPGVSELAAAASVAVELGATIEDLAAAIVAHPTLAEVLSDAVATTRRQLET